MIVITDATGKVGHAIVKKLVETVPAGDIGVSVRNPTKSEHLKAVGVRGRKGDFADAKSMKHAFEGASKVLLVSSNARVYGGDPMEQHRNAIEAAKHVGPERINYTSHMAASDNSAFAPMHDHANTELELAQSGMARTSFRQGFYASSVVGFFGPALDTGAIHARKDGKVCWTTHADLAAADAAPLAKKSGHIDGPTPALTGSKTLDFADFAKIASKLKGSLVKREIVSDEKYPAMKSKAPSGVGTKLLGIYIAVCNSEFNAVGLMLAELIGRKPQTIYNVIATSLKKQSVPREAILSTA